MPRERRQPQRKTGTLNPYTRELLLFGWGGPGPLDATDADDPFEPFEYSEIDYARIWREHRDELLTEWAKRGHVGQPWAAKFDAEGGDQ